MAADQFVFRHFVIKQEKCPMKVGTDALVIGAYVEPDNAKTMLDIGTGTGILALMLAQKSKKDVTIDAIDIDGDCVMQASANFKTSAWNHKLRVHHTSVADFMPIGLDSGYDLIISNPPYFGPNLKAEKESAAYFVRKNARSFAGMNYEMLVSEAQRLLHADGRFYVIIPAEQAAGFIDTARRFGLSLFDRLLVYSRRGQKAIRSILGFSRQNNGAAAEHSLVIYDNDGAYSDEYIALTGNFYAMDMQARKEKRKKLNP